MPCQTMFDKPQAKLLPDSAGRRMYANVSNAMEIALSTSKTFHVALAVPTELFTLFKEVCHFGPEEEVLLSIDMNDGRYVFSAMCGDDLFDLWSYSERSIPQWILNPQYRL